MGVVIFTRGSLTSSEQSFNKFAAYLTGHGLLSIKRDLWRGINWSLISFALAKRLSLFFAKDASWNSEQSFGAIFAVTEMHPLPPFKLNSNAVPSSPESWIKSFTIFFFFVHQHDLNLP